MTKAPLKKRIEKNTLPADIDHYLAVTEFIIAVRQLPKLEPRISLHSTIHDWLLRESEYPSTVFQGRDSDPIDYPFHPDNLTEFHLIRGVNEQPIAKRIFLEMDMGTHTSRSRFKKKLAAYVDFFSSGTYAQLLGNVRNYVVLYATPKGEGRRDELRLWTREDFEQQPFRPRKFLKGYDLTAEDRSIFRFVSLPEGALDPKQMMFHPIYYPAGLYGDPEPLVRLPN